MKLLLDVEFTITEGCVVTAEILHQDESLRDIGTISSYKLNKTTYYICSNICPEVNNYYLYLRGANKRADNNTDHTTYDFFKEKYAREYIKAMQIMIDEINGAPKLSFKLQEKLNI